MMQEIVDFFGGNRVLAATFYYKEHRSATSLADWLDYGKQPSAASQRKIAEQHAKLFRDGALNHNAMVIRLLCKFSRTQLAERLGVSCTALANWERGVNVPREMHQAAIVSVYEAESSGEGSSEEDSGEEDSSEEGSSEEDSSEEDSSEEDEEDNGINGSEEDNGVNGSEEDNGVFGFPIGSRVRFVGDDINNTPHIYTTLGTVIGATGTTLEKTSSTGRTLKLRRHWAYVDWDDTGKNLEHWEDIEVATAAELESDIVESAGKRKREQQQLSHSSSSSSSSSSSVGAKRQRVGGLPLVLTGGFNLRHVSHYFAVPQKTLEAWIAKSEVPEEHAEKFKTFARCFAKDKCKMEQALASAPCPSWCNLCLSNN